MAQEYPDGELRQAARHVAHEIAMLASAWKRHASDSHAYVGWFVHCRTLMDFFSGECPSHGRDVCAWHFFDSESGENDGRARWDEIRGRLDPPPEDYEGDDSYRQAVNELAAHLSYERVKIAERQQKDPGHFAPSAEVTEYLRGLADLFLRQLPPERAGWFGAVRMT